MRRRIWPWTKCHCGTRADYRSTNGADWCWPCKFAVHATCECSRADQPGWSNP